MRLGICILTSSQGFPGGSDKNLPVMWETRVHSLGWENSLKKEMQPTPIFLPGESHGLEPGSHKVSQDWATNSNKGSVIREVLGVYLEPVYIKVCMTEGGCLLQKLSEPWAYASRAVQRTDKLGHTITSSTLSQDQLLIIIHMRQVFRT